MELAEISKLFQDNVNNVLTPNKYKHVIRRDNNLGRFDIVNRILIEIQCQNAYDIRTADEWVLSGREVKNNTKGIHILLPMYKHCYIDTETGEEVRNGELTPDELNAAIRYGIVNRNDSIETTCIKTVFDIRQTKSLCTKKYTIEKPIIKTSSIIEMVSNIIRCSIEPAQDTYYSKSTNTMFISKQSFNKLIPTIVDILVEHYMSTLIREAVNSYDENIEDEEEKFSEYDIDLVRNTLQYSLDTLLRNNRECDFDIVRHTKSAKLLLILSIVDSVVSSVISYLEFKGGDTAKRDISDSIDIMKRAEILLNILEANNVSKKISGM